MDMEYNIEELIVRYLQQDINEKELHYLESWLEEDMEHRIYFFELKNISDSTRYPFHLRQELAEDSWQKMKARLEKDQNVKKRTSGNITPLHTLLKYAAIVIVAVGMGWLLNETRRENTRTPSPEDAIVYNEIHVQRGSRANTLLLSDGSKVVLNAATTFKYPSTFNGNERRVYLDGEAYFEVAKDAHKPFVVKLKNQHVTVLGTTFNVEAYEKEAYSKTTLINGSISLEAFNEKGESVSHMLLKPNQQALSDNQVGSIFLKEVDVSFVKDWTQGIYKFKDEPLSTIVKQLEKHYDVNIYLEEDWLKSIRYTGSFSFDQSISEILSIINSDKQFEYKRIGNNILITGK